MTYTFNDLLGLLPNCDQFPTVDSKPLSVVHQLQEPDNFIPPNLSINKEFTEQPPQNAPVIIISAPGAVGKSTLGKAIAFNKKALFWDLSIAGEVGEGSLDGMLQSTIGRQRIGEFHEYWENGYQFLVIDALDEGRIKVTENAFRRLLQDVSGLSQNSLSPRFVLLGRTRIAEESWLVLDEEGIESSILSIDSFDREQAHQFISNKMGANTDNETYRDCRDLIFDRLEKSIQSGTASAPSENFLHYPPVLDVISTLLNREANPLSLKNKLSENQTEVLGKPSALLRNVITLILEREQSKVTSQSQWKGWDTLYGTDEQRKRLLSEVLKTQIPQYPSILPDWLEQDYASTVDAFLPEHPFLQSSDKFANVVFQSYLYASALLGECGGDLQSRVTEELLKPDNLPHRLLADFYFSGIRSEQGNLMKISPAHLGILYDSLLSSESTQSYVRLNIDGPEPGASGLQEIETVEGEFEFLQDTIDQNTSTPPSRFSIEITSDTVISFTRSLRDAFITVPCIVELLGGSTQEFKIGPAVQINANTIRINSEVLIVGGKTRLRPLEEDVSAVILEAQTCDSTVIQRPTIPDNTIRLVVMWPGSEAFPWTNFRRESSYPNFSDNQRLDDVYRRFRKIATEFRSHGKGSLARSTEILEHRFVTQGELGNKLLGQLLKDKIITQGVGSRHTRYFWNSEIADPLLDVTWENLRQWAMPETLREYLLRFISAHPELF